MAAEALQQTPRQPLRATVVSPPRLRPKGPVGPEFYRRRPASETPGMQRQSAVERLEADKAKYVKSQVALSKRQPIRALERPSAPLQPTRRSPAPISPKQEMVQLNMEHLSILISGFSDGAQASPPGAHCPPIGALSGSQKPKEKPSPPPRPAKVRLRSPVPARLDSPVVAGSPAVRRVDVVPQADPTRTAGPTRVIGPTRAAGPTRPPQYMRPPLQPIHSQFPLQPSLARQRLTPLRAAPLCPLPEPPPHGAPSPPASPAITRLSSSSCRKRPSLTRSKSDMSDRCSRAGTELERFFNLCGLDPADLPELAASSSDIVSLARFRSVSAPGSECGGSRVGGEEEEEEVDAKASDRAPYGVSVIERNARVIKWLYGLRQAKDTAVKSTNL